MRDILYQTTDNSAIELLLKFAVEFSNSVDESSGQFTGGYSDKVYSFKDSKVKISVDSEGTLEIYKEISLASILRKQHDY